MYKIEKTLLELGFDHKEAYPSGVIVYSENTYDTDVALYPDKKQWEINGMYPFLITLTSTSNDDHLDSSHIRMLCSHISELTKIKRKLLELENPWEEITD